VQYVEIYNEVLQDLLAGYTPRSAGASATCTGGSGGRPDVRENSAGEVVVEGATVVSLTSPAELAEAVDYGMACRAVGAHK
jgi:hypothetical protein